MRTIQDYLTIHEAAELLGVSTSALRAWHLAGKLTAIRNPMNRHRLYLVRDTTDHSRLRPDERRKIKCGERHFDGALGVDYKVVTSVGELP